MSEKERYDISMATIYGLRLIISGDEKDRYTKGELVNLIDSFAMEQEQV